MKRLILAAVLAAMAGGVVADEPAPEKAAPAKVAEKRPARPAFDRAKFEARIRERQAERRAKVAEVLKAAGIEESKVKGLVDEIDKVYSARPPRPPRRPRAGGESHGTSGTK